MKKQLPKVVLIGAGRLANHLGIRLKEMEVPVVQVFSRTKPKAQSLGKQLNCDFTTNLKEISSEAGIYIIAVHDKAIVEVAATLSEVKGLKDKLFVHTSGATPSTVLQPFFKNYGGFYPLQTFSSNRKVDFSQIPICIDARYVRDKKRLTKLAKMISRKVYLIDDQQRSMLHVAAVFVNNFANHMFAIGERLAKENDLPFDLLRPLLLETVMKVQLHSPSEMQTGPAIRNDTATIERHLQFLEEAHPEYAELYRMITASIGR